MKELIFTLALRGICQKKASILNTLTYLSIKFLSVMTDDKE